MTNKVEQLSKKVERLIEKCKSLIPLEGRILVHPEKLRTYKEMQVFNTDVPYDEIPLPGDAPELVESVKEPQEVQTEEKEVVVNRRYQTAVILGLPEGETRFNVGDTIVYSVGSIWEFDLIKGISVIHKYDPIAKLV